jgi:hypothetical protein
MNGIAAFFLVMFGCSDDLSQCRQLPVEPVSHVSAQTCEGEIDTALMYRGATANYPTIIADCLSGKQLAALQGGAVDFSKPVPVLIARR